MGPGGYGRRRRRDPLYYSAQYRDQQIIRILLALAHQIMLMERKPPVTLLLAAVNVLFFLRPEGIDDLVPTIRSGCLNPSKIIYSGEWYRVLWAPLLHADEYHLYYNIVSLLWKGAQLEPALGSLYFLALVIELGITSSCLYLGLAYLLAGKGSAWFLLWRGFRRRRAGLMGSCAIGFSGILFGFKSILHHNTPGWTVVAGFRLPIRYVAWAELVIAQFVSPEASFIGHLCGILAGLLHIYVSRPLIYSNIAAFRRRRGNSRTPPTWGHGTWGT